MYMYVLQVCPWICWSVLEQHTKHLLTQRSQVWMCHPLLLWCHAWLRRYCPGPSWFFSPNSRTEGHVELMDKRWLAGRKKNPSNFPGFTQFGIVNRDSGPYQCFLHLIFKHSWCFPRVGALALSRWYIVLRIDPEALATQSTPHSLTSYTSVRVL